MTEVKTSVEDTLAQRGSRYGNFTDHARICQRLKNVMVETTSLGLVPEPKGWAYLSDVQKQALEVIADKIARILSGDPNYDDNWHDIQGYAKLAEDSLPCNQPKPVPVIDAPKVTIDTLLKGENTIKTTVISNSQIAAQQGI